jgi:4-alpha-glucanotransferase
MCYDSADAWTHPELFKLDAQKRPRYVGGVPPDYFSKTGQLWGNPAYNWQEIEKTHFQWWMDRLRCNLKMCDIMRLDHFRGFTAYWQIPASCKTAKEGRWIRAPSKGFFDTLRGFFSSMPFIGEDLGLITNNVRNSVERLGIPGMRVLIFAFGGSENNPNLPTNYPENSVAYTGTHDTNTVKGWFVEEATPEETEQVFKCVGKHVSKNEISREFIRLALESKANLNIIPVQDVLDLGSEARMNYPSRRFHNWEWRVKSEQFSSKSFEELAKMTKNIGRIE